MRLIRALVFPWFVYFAAVVGGLCTVAIRYPHFQESIKFRPVFVASVFGVFLLCLLANLSSLNNVGIWISESLPESLRYSSTAWLSRAMKALLVAAVFWGIGQTPWVPLIWQAVVIPAVFTICLFVFLWNLFGPILKFSANMAWSHLFSMVLSFPIVAIIPLTACFLAQNIVQAYHASNPDMPITSESHFDILKAASALRRDQIVKPVEVADEDPNDEDNEAVSQHLDDKEIRGAIHSQRPERRSLALTQLRDSRSNCELYAHEIQIALEPNLNDDIVYAAVRDVHCSGIRTVIGMSRLTSIMMDHKVARTRAAAILAMPTYGEANVRNVAYLLFKRLSETESPEVAEAAAVVLSKLNSEQRRIATNRLKPLLMVDSMSASIAKVLVQNYGREDLIAEYVQQNLNGDARAQFRSIAMICLLSKDKRSIVESHISNVVASIHNPTANDPGFKALSCLGPAGFNAIREEVSRPHVLPPAVAARALSEFNVKDTPEALEVANKCARDGNPQVRQWCSQSLGKIGEPALPKILDLLQSNDSDLKDSGQNALKFFHDDRAKGALQQIRAQNSGWMANNRNLQIAKAVSTALLKIENEQRPGQTPGAAPSSGVLPLDSRLNLKPNVPMDRTKSTEEEIPTTTE